MASLLSSSAATVAGAVLLPVGHPASRSSAGGRLVSLAAPEDTKVGSGLLVLAVPEGATGGWGLLPANTTKATRGSGVVALAAPGGASGGWGFLHANTFKTSRGSRLVALAVPESATGGWGFVQADTSKTSRGSGLLALAVPEGATGGWGFIQSDTTKTSRGSGLVALAVPEGATGGWGLLPANATKTSRGDDLVVLALPEEDANRWSGWGPLPEDAPAEDVKAFYAEDFVKRVEKIGTINSYALFGGHAHTDDILKVAAEAAERCIMVVDLVQPVLVDQFASRPRAKIVVGVITNLSVRLVENCRIVLSECKEDYVREHPLREAFYRLSAINRRGYPKPPLVTASRTEAEKVAYFKHLADEFKELTFEVEARVYEWIDSDSAKSATARWYDQPVKMRFDD